MITVITATPPTEQPTKIEQMVTHSRGIWDSVWHAGAGRQQAAIELHALQHRIAMRTESYLRLRLRRPHHLSLEHILLGQYKY